eukprot:m.50955 g.50955  ORF g.50955 m.50955 type:complete len:183 (-) comp21367_c1_seq1:59-607(-)
MDDVDGIVRGDLTKTRDTSETMHLMPCSIASQGRANVTDFFESVIRKEIDPSRSLFTNYEDVTETPETDGVLTAAFRGRRLRGSNVSIPQGFTGVVLTEDRTRRSNGNSATCWVPASKFSKFTLWNLEEIPTDNDPIAQALKWCELSKALHCAPPSGEDVRRSPRKNKFQDYTGMDSPKKKK